MSKRLVVCCDGTWNEPDETRGGLDAPTNVARLALGVVTGEDSGQLLYYEPGVGTAPDDRLLGGAFGYGLARNVRNAYQFLVKNFESGDQLFLFGFSRGAYTARSLAGLIRNCGILCRNNLDQIDEAFAFYRDSTPQTHPRGLAAQIFREMYAHDDDEIHFIGVWDTVGALGIPTELPGWNWLSQRLHGWEKLWGFHDTQLSSHVHFAYHALSIDETREPFKPTLWTSDDIPPSQTVEQVWFSGVHTEVGGGSDKSELSDIALLWLVDKATAAGLAVKPGCLASGAPNGAGAAIAPDYAGPITDSRQGFWKDLPMGAYHRLAHEDVRAAPAQSVASSAARRFRERVNNYAPRGLDSFLSTHPVTEVVEES